MASKQIIIHLVPGTWYDGVGTAIGRRLFPSRPYSPLTGHDRWFQDGHSFRKSLDAALTQQGIVAEFRPFLWSGFNSFRARADAAQELVPQLAKGATEGKPQAIIGHSHGGSVAMLALKLASEGQASGSFVHEGEQLWMPQTRKSQQELVVDLADIVKLSTEKLRQAVNDIDLITLATPFLRVEPYNSGNSISRSIQFCCFVLYLAAWILVSRRWGYFAGNALCLGFGVALSLAYRFLHKSRAVIKDSILNNQATVFPGRRILCVRGNADEAALGISLGIIACNLNRVLVTTCGILLGRVPTFLTLLACTAAVILMTLAVRAPPDASLRWVSDVAVAASLPVLWVTVASLAQASLGIDLIWNGFDLLTTVESSPDAPQGHLSIQTLTAESRAGRSMRHSIYEHSGCLSAILPTLVSRFN
jgi:hypothetical protein